MVVVNHGSSDLLRRNLAAHDPRPVAEQVVVVDNYSSAAEARAVRDLADRMGWHLVALTQNVGFGAGMNAGVARARALGCTAFLLLNPDARIDIATCSPNSTATAPQIRCGCSRRASCARTARRGSTA